MFHVKHEGRAAGSGRVAGARPALPRAPSGQPTPEGKPNRPRPSNRASAPRQRRLSRSGAAPRRAARPPPAQLARTPRARRRSGLRERLKSGRQPIAATTASASRGPGPPEERARPTSFDHAPHHGATQPRHAHGASRRGPPRELSSRPTPGPQRPLFGRPPCRCTRGASLERADQRRSRALAGGHRRARPRGTAARSPVNVPAPAQQRRERAALANPPSRTPPWAVVTGCASRPR